MKRKLSYRLKDILESIDKIEEYTENISARKFYKDTEKQDSVIRRLEIIGEAATKILSEFKDIKNKYKNISWQEISGLRNILIHEYPGINLQTVWDIIQNDLPQLKKQTQLLYEKEVDQNKEKQ